VTPVEVLEALGFEWVDFATLPDSLMQVGKSSGYGRMDESLSILMKSPDGKTVYCFLDAGSNLYSWARYVLKDEVWEKDPMNHDSSIGEIITTLGRIEVDGWVK
jgi:hypothetical protein